MIPSSSIPVQISPGASSSSGVKRTYSESAALPNLPGVTSSSGVKRARIESTAPPNPPVVSSGSGLKRAHEKSTANDDDEEQPGTRARISTLIAGLHGVDAAEDEICHGDEVPDKWLSSWCLETHMSQKMVF